jgi:hypothetical protein
VRTPPENDRGRPARRPRQTDPLAHREIAADRSRPGGVDSLRRQVASLRRRLEAIEAALVDARAEAASEPEYMAQPPEPGSPAWSGHLAELSAQLGSLAAAYAHVEGQRAERRAA